MPDLVVNADDFGLTPGVCRGILRAHRDGIVTSTSALVVAPAFDAHARSLADAGLPTGIHLCAVGEDRPLLDRSEIPTLVDRDGRLAPTWRTFVGRAARGAIDPEDLRREFTAQIECLTRAGLTPTHVDSHQHLHLLPAVATVALALAEEHGVPAMRITGTARRTPVAAGVRVLGAVLRRRARRARLRTPATAAGLDEAGRMDAAALDAALRRMAGSDGAVDLTVHPGADPDPDRVRYRWGYRWPDELAALCDPGLPTRLDAMGYRLVSYSDLGAPR